MAVALRFILLCLAFALLSSCALLYWEIRPPDSLTTEQAIEDIREYVNGLGLVVGSAIKDRASYRRSPLKAGPGLRADARGFEWPVRIGYPPRRTSTSVHAQSRGYGFAR